MEALARMSVPIRELTDVRVAELEAAGARDPAHEAYPVPKEVWHLVDHLYRSVVWRSFIYLHIYFLKRAREVIFDTFSIYYLSCLPCW